MLFELGKTPSPEAASPETAAPQAASAAARPDSGRPAVYTGPLRAPRLESPANNFLFDAERLRGISGITFRWAAVEGADGYGFALFSPGGSTILSARTEEPSYLLGDLSALSKGQFRWQVRALRRGAAGEERGPASESLFTVDIPEVRRNQLEDIGTMYGR
jgi:hypothetical protein